MYCPNCGATISETARFCSKCGTSLTSTTSAETADQPIHTPSLLPAAPAVPHQHASRRVTAAIFVLLLPGAVTAFFLFSRFASDPGRLLYVVYDELDFFGATAIAKINLDGSDNRKFIHNREVFFSGGFVFSDENRVISPDGHWLAIYRMTADNSGELVLMTTEEETPLLVHARAFPYNPSGFSSDSKYFAYTTVGESRDEFTLRVVNDGGLEVLAVPDAIFVDFFPNSERLLVIEFNTRRQLFALAWLNLEDGVMNRLADLSESLWERLWVVSGVSIWPFLPAPSGEQVFYNDGERLMVVDIASGAARNVYARGNELLPVSFSPDHRFLVVFDESGVYLMTLDEQKIIPIEGLVQLAVMRWVWGEGPVAFSPDGNRLAYLRNDIGGNNLYVSGVDGRNLYRISEDNAWDAFAFSPSGKQIAFVEGADFDTGGTLYVADVDGNDRVRLDGDVWSLRYTEDGRYLAYSKVEGLEQDTPQLEIYRIRPNGEDRELLLGPQDGVIALLGWLPSRTDE